MESNTYLKQLGEALDVLAAPADVQVQHLKQLGVFPSTDELALEYSDLAVLADAKHRDGELDDALYQQVIELDRMLRDMSGSEKADLWQPQALYQSPEWDQVRRIAAAARERLERDLSVRT